MSTTEKNCPHLSFKILEIEDLNDEVHVDSLELDRESRDEIM